MSSPQTLETIGDLELKLQEFLSFQKINGGVALIYTFEAIQVRVIIGSNNLYNPDGTPFINKGESIWDIFDSPLHPSHNLYLDPSQNQQLKFRMALVQGPEFYRYNFTENAPYLIQDKYKVSVREEGVVYPREYLRFFREISNCQELLEAIKAVNNASSELQNYKAEKS